MKKKKKFQLIASSKHCIFVSEMKRRHFVGLKRDVSDDESSGSSELDEVDDVEVKKVRIEPELPVEEEKLYQVVSLPVASPGDDSDSDRDGSNGSDSGSDSESSDSSEDSDSSDSDNAGPVVLQYVRKKKQQKPVEPKLNSDKKEISLLKWEHSINAQLALEKLSKQTVSEDLGGIDDTDDVDPEKEYEEWLLRERHRVETHRAKLIAREEEEAEIEKERQRLDESGVSG